MAAILERNGTRGRWAGSAPSGPVARSWVRRDRMTNAGEEQPAPRPQRRRPRLTMLAATAAVLVACGIAWAIHGTRYERQRLAFVSSRAGAHTPDWSRPCWRRGRPPHQARYTLPCARVVGRVVYTQKRDPDGDGDTHILVVAGLRLVNLKFRHGVERVDPPGVGRRLRVTGVLGRGRFGVPEVDVARIG